MCITFTQATALYFGKNMSFLLQNYGHAKKITVVSYNHWCAHRNVCPSPIQQTVSLLKPKYNFNVNKWWYVYAAIYSLYSIDMLMNTALDIYAIGLTNI